MFSYRRRSYLKLFTIPYRLKTTSRKQLYNKCYNILGVDEFTDQNTVRSTYIALVKQFHPDSGKAEASTERFLEIDGAFKVLQEKYAKERRGIEINMEDEVKIFDIKHTAPQHRQYLSFDGVGTGTPAQREKQYQSRRAMKAQEKVLEHRVQKAQGQGAESALMTKGSFFKTHAIKTKYGFDRVVEDLIQEAMSKGDFHKLKGSGKPLPNHQSQNPYVDFTTHKMNKILLDNGFIPEWITLQKEIRIKVHDVRKSLYAYRMKYRLHPPLSADEKRDWLKIVEEQKDTIDGINKSIRKFNLIVPIIDKQMVHVESELLASKVLDYTEFNGEPIAPRDPNYVPVDMGGVRSQQSSQSAAANELDAQTGNFFSYFSKVFTNF